MRRSGFLCTLACDVAGDDVPRLPSDDWNTYGSDGVRMTRCMHHLLNDIYFHAGISQGA